MDQELVINELAAVWMKLEMADDASPEQLDNALGICLGQFPRFCGMALQAARELKKKLKEFEVAPNASQYDKMRHASVEYFIDKTIRENIERLASHEMSLQGKLKNYRRELNNANKSGIF